MGRPRREFTEEQIKLICNGYSSGTTINWLVKRFSSSSKMIKKTLADNKIELRSTLNTEENVGEICKVTHNFTHHRRRGKL
jgi:hypothetical protein